MKKKICTLVYGFTSMFFIFVILHQAGSLDNIYKRFGVVSDDFEKEIITTFKAENQVPFIVYMPNSTNTLKPSVLNIDINGNLYKNIIQSLILHNNKDFKGEHKVLSAVRDDSLIRLKLSNSFRSDLYTDEERFNLIIMSFVNTLSEIKGVEFVEIYSGKEKIAFKGVSKFKRDTTFINYRKIDRPDKVLEEQMKLEQEGEFLDSYLLMSCEQTQRRKMYYEYLEEMKQIEQVGFLDGNFKIKNTRTYNDEAIVNVEFNNVSKSGEPVNTTIMPIKCIKVNGVWMVDW